LLDHFCNAKKLELDFKLTFELAYFLCADHGELALDVLLALEEMQLYLRGTLLYLKFEPSGMVDAL
jgi:hypothetical protein